jgi:hypothetical protein
VAGTDASVIVPVMEAALAAADEAVQLNASA